MLNRRTRLHFNKYPTHTNYRQLHGILRDSDGYLVFPKVINNQIVYFKTDIKDIVEIKPNKKGQRSFTRKYLNVLENNIVDFNFKGELFAYCIHEIIQILRPISDFTTNKIYPITAIKIDEFGNIISLQPFCKKSKQLYVNSGPAGNSSRSKDQYLEDTGSRFRTKIIESITKTRPKIVYDEIYKKFNGCCFKCKTKISYNQSIGIKSNLDHTLPHSLYYPYTTQNSTLLCVDCNQSKKNRWPSDFYTDSELNILSKLTGISYEILSGSRRYNLELIIEFANNFDEIIKNIECRFRKRTTDNRLNIFNKIKKDMITFGNLHTDYLSVSNLIITKFNNYIYTNYTQYAQ